MTRVNITVPDDLAARARSHGLNISAAAAAGLANELELVEKRLLLRAQLDALEAELGPPDADETAEATRWANRVLDRVTADDDAVDPRSA